jgi:hypothetical protein
MSDRDYKDRAFEGSMRREEFRHFVIEECKARGA